MTNIQVSQSSVQKHDIESLKGSRYLKYKFEDDIVLARVVKYSRNKVSLCDIHSFVYKEVQVDTHWHLTRNNFSSVTILEIGKEHIEDVYPEYFI